MHTASGPGTGLQELPLAGKTQPRVEYCRTMTNLRTRNIQAHRAAHAMQILLLSLWWLLEEVLATCDGKLNGATV